MEGHRKTVRLIPDELHQVQHRRVVIENHRFVFLAEDVNYLLAFRDRSEWLIDDLQGSKCISRGVELPQAAIYQNQAGHFFLFILKALVSSGDHFAH